MAILIKNIKELLQIEDSPKLLVKGEEMKKMQTLKNAWLLIKEGKIDNFGSMNEFDERKLSAEFPDIEVIDASGKMVMPAFVDSHTHLVYPESREIEYIDKIKGLSYEEIAKRGGGILNSAKKMQEISEEELYNSAMPRLNEIALYGTGAVEIKSGYGLSIERRLTINHKSKFSGCTCNTT